ANWRRSFSRMGRNRFCRVGPRPTAFSRTPGDRHALLSPQLRPRRNLLLYGRDLRPGTVSNVRFGPSDPPSGIPCAKTTPPIHDRSHCPSPRSLACHLDTPSGRYGLFLAVEQDQIQLYRRLPRRRWEGTTRDQRPEGQGGTRHLAETV